MESKNFPVFDSDAHVTEGMEIWEFVAEADREIVRSSLWIDPVVAPGGLLNGRQWTVVEPGPGGSSGTGPGCTKEALRAIRLTRDLTPEILEHMDHLGAYEPKARLADLDVVGIDQVLVVPSMMNENLYYVQNAHAARAIAWAYNDWAFDFYCAEDPVRLHPCGILPLQSPAYAIEEVNRLAAKGFKVVAIRPIDALGLYPNQPLFEPVWSALEDSGMVVGMHAFPTVGINPDGSQPTPGELLMSTGRGTGLHGVSTEPGQFIYEASTWTAYALLGGLLDRHPRLRMSIFEANCTWLPSILESCDRAFKLYARNRPHRGDRLPSEAFREQCRIGFEGEEPGPLANSDHFADIAIWASDMYHHDALGAWESLDYMEKAGVPGQNVRKMFGENAATFYGIEPKLVITTRQRWQPPSWWPSDDEVRDSDGNYTLSMSDTHVLEQGRAPLTSPNNYVIPPGGAVWLGRKRPRRALYKHTS